MINQLKLSSVLVVIWLLVASAYFGWAAEFNTESQIVFREGETEFFASLEVIHSPKNNWRPGNEPLPISLAECAKRAKERLLKQQPKVPVEVSLISAEVRPLILPSTNQHQKARPLQKPQSSAWYLVFTFSNVLPDGTRLDYGDCTIGMMFDGTILETVKRRQP